VGGNTQHEASEIGPGTLGLSADDWLQSSTRILRLVTGRGSLVRIGLFVAAVTWIPLLVLTAVEGTLVGGRTIAASQSLGMHTRLLVSIPLFFLAESLFIRRASEVVRALRQAQIVEARDLPGLASAWRQADALWNSWATEAALAAFTIVSIYVGLRVDVSTAASTWRTALDGHLTLAGWWYTLVSLPLFQFLLWRWAWRYLVWSRLLWQISRMDLRLLPTHPDRVAGLGPFGVAHVDLAPVGCAVSAIFAASFAEQIIFAGASLNAFVVPATAIVMATSAILTAPLLFFCDRLLEVKQRGLLEYGRLGARYTRRFDAKWIHGDATSDEPILGTADLQSLADLGNSFDVIRRMRLVPIAWSQVVLIVVLAALPMLTLLLFEFPLDQLIIGGLRLLAGV
jgi:hypothetical protein